VAPKLSHLSDRSGVRTGTPGAAIHLARVEVSPVRAMTRRIVIALLVLGFVVGWVYLDRDGYRDAAGDGVSLLDAVYYATVSLSTTGYGDIVPVTDEARLFNILVVTPARVAFLIVLVGTTLEVLTERSREALAVGRWRRSLREHVVVCGYGTKGRSAITAMTRNGFRKDQIVVVDTDAAAVEEANAAGLNVIHGSGTRTDVLRQAGVDKASIVIVAPKADDTAVLTTLTARELNTTARIIASVRESENAHLLKQSGANQVITTSEAAGRLLGLSTESPRLVSVVEDLLTPGSGLEIVEREAPEDDIGRSVKNLREPVVAIVRDGEMYRWDSPEANRIEQGDRLICVCAVVEE
jgi:voltage-gated potassium channel